MIECISLATGILSGLVLLYCIFKHKRFDELKITMIQVVSWIFCSIALYLPFIKFKQARLIDDYCCMTEAVVPSHIFSTVLLGMVLILNITLFFLNRKALKGKIIG